MSRDRRSAVAELPPETGCDAEPLDAARLERELDAVAAAVLPGGAPGDERALGPQPISAAELVRRVRPFIGWN